MSIFLNVYAKKNDILMKLPCRGLKKRIFKRRFGQISCLLFSFARWNLFVMTLSGLWIKLRSLITMMFDWNFVWNFWRMACCTIDSYSPFNHLLFNHKLWVSAPADSKLYRLINSITEIWFFNLIYLCFKMKSGVKSWFIE